MTNIPALEEAIFKAQDGKFASLKKFICNNDPKWTAKKMFEEDGFWMDEALARFDRMLTNKLNIKSEDIDCTLNITTVEDKNIVSLVLSYEGKNENSEEQWFNLTFINEESCEVWYNSSGVRFEIANGDFEITFLNFWGAFEHMPFVI